MRPLISNEFLYSSDTNAFMYNDSNRFNLCTACFLDGKYKHQPVILIKLIIHIRKSMLQKWIYMH